MNLSFFSVFFSGGYGGGPPQRKCIKFNFLNKNKTEKKTQHKQKLTLLIAVVETQTLPKLTIPYFNSHFWY